jgi:3-oxoacyl-[acyl-carrier-protein] synthase II
VDVLTLSKRLSHSALGTLSPSMLRAFDTRHDGTLLGEGAAFLVLQALDERARPLAIYRGSGMANDAAGMTAPDVTGGSVCLAIERSLSDAELTAEDIRLVNAHGSGTLLNDQTEREALQRAFPGTAKPAVFATKGNFGHSLGATGAIEAMALLLAMRHANVPPIVALEQPDPAFALPLPVGRILDWPAPFGLSLTLGFGGFDTSLVFEVPS